MLTGSRQNTVRRVFRLIALTLSILTVGALGSAIACDAMVTFDYLVPGMVYNAASGFPAGSLLFVEDGIAVRSGNLRLGGASYYGDGIVDFAITAPFTFGRNLIFRPQNMTLNFDLTRLGITVTEVRFKWCDTGGTENLRVNGAPLYIGNIEAAPAAIAPGITFNCRATAIPYGLKGRARLLGEVRRFSVGGQEFALDDICVIGVAPGSLTPVVITLPLAGELGDDGEKAVQTEGSSWGGVKAIYK